MKDDLHNLGYDKEAEYFYKKNQELIEKKRQQLNSAKEQTKSEHSEKDFWMICPKCGGQMVEKNLLNILIDECGSCQGIYFDKGELETLMHAQEASGFFKAFEKK